MSIDEQTAAKIDDYLNNKLSDKERKQFESELKNNQELADELQIQKNLLKIIGENGILTSDSNSFPREAIDEVSGLLASLEMEKIRKNIKEVNSQYLKRKSISRSMVYRFTAIAASIVVLLTIGIALQLNIGQEDLYDEYKDNYHPISLVQRSDNDTALESIEKSFREKNFAKVLELITQNQPLIQESPSILIYQGIAYRELDQPADAIKSFETFGSLNNLDMELMYWHQGLVYLKIGDFEKAKTRFSKIDRDGNFKAIKEVNEILNILRYNTN